MTGVGKSDLTLQLKEQLNGEIICADASQIYQGLDVLTNKITLDKDTEKPHLMGHWDHVDKVTSSKYALECRKIIKDVIGRGKTPILEGGSGFYIYSVFNPTLLTPQPGFEEAKEEAREILEKHNYSHVVMKQYDPDNSLGINDQFSQYRY